MNSSNLGLNKQNTDRRIV